MLDMSKTQKSKGTLILAVLFLIVTFFVYAPFELYLTNQQEFWFSISAFAFIPLLMAVIVGAILIAVGMIMKEKYRKYFSAVIFGLALAIYLQSNFLNAKIGVLNGADINWQEYKVTFGINLIIWLLCVMLPCVLMKVKSHLMNKGIGYVSALFSMMQIVTLVVLAITSYKPAESQYEWYISDRNLFEVSSKDNVVVFLLDMYDDRYFKEILDMEPEIVDELEGFTYFANSTGNYSTTVYSMGTLFTGQYLYNEKPFGEQLHDASEKSKMIDTLLDNGYRLDVYTIGAPPNILPKTSNYVEGEIKISDYVQFTKSLYQLVACKYLPDMIKPFVWMDGTEFNQFREPSGNTEKVYESNNVTFYKNIKKNGISVNDDEKCFKFIYLDGAHYPYYIDENVKAVEEEDTSELQCARGALRIVQAYMDEMKKSGVYDNTSIIIMADHGYYWDGVLTNPVLLVKPENATGALQVSNAPVSQHDFQPSVLSLAGLNDDMRFGESYFDIPEGVERERLFYQYYLQEGAIDGNYRLIEYRIGSDSNKRESFELTDIEYGPTGEVYSHKENCEFCQSGEVEPIETEENVPIKVVHSRIE